MQLGLQAIPPVGIIFDSDFGNDIDDVLAMALLYGLDGKNECRFVATTISKPNLKSAALCDAIGRFYAGEVSAAFNAFGRTLPVGLATSGKGAEDTPMLSVVAKYRHGIADITDTADPVDVLRNALSAQHPQNAIVVCSGPVSNLAALLRFPLGKSIAAERCKLLVIAADQASLADIAEWPTPIVIVGPEVGAAIPFPASSLDKDFAWSTAHPIVDAHKAYKPMPYDATTTAMAAVLYAVRAKDNLFQLSEHRRLMVDPTTKDRVQQMYIELASAKPVPKMPRRRFNQQQQQQQNEKM